MIQTTDFQEILQLTDQSEVEIIHSKTSSLVQLKYTDNQM